MRDRRVRKPTTVPHSRFENEYDPDAVPQYIQVSVNVLEARKLLWMNPQAATSYVMAMLGRAKERTTLRKNMEEPLYREHLVFELFMSIREIQKASLWLAVMEPKCCAPPKILGEANIDMGAVWAQPNHQVYHKWAQLTLPRDSDSAGPAGFLKVDISILFRGEVQVMPAVISDDKIEHNLLLPTNAEQQKANYLVTIHAAFCLPSYVAPDCDRRYGKPPSTFVRVSFCGLVAKTSVQTRTNDPIFNQRISIVEMFPNMTHIVRFDVCSADGCFNRVMAHYELQLGDISHDGDNGFLPTFGPSLLHMYGPCVNGDEGPYHKGALLVSLKTIVPYFQESFRNVSVMTVPPINPDNLWLQEDFLVITPIFEISMLDREIAGTEYNGIAVTMGEIPSSRKGDEEFMSVMAKLKSRKMHYTGNLQVQKIGPYGCIEFPNQYPVLQLPIRLPDFRFRMYKNNIVQSIFTALDKALVKVEKRLNQFDYTSPNELVDDLNRAVDDAAGNILKYLDIIQYSSNASTEESPQQYFTELDQKQLTLQKEEIEKIYNQVARKGKGDSSTNLCQLSRGTRDSLIGSRKMVKITLAETKALAENLKNTIYKSMDGWPDIVIWLLNEAGSRVAFAKIPAAEVIYSVIPEQCGSNCGQIQTIYMKPLKCPKHANKTQSNCVCIAAKVELLVWMGLFRQRHALSSQMPSGYTIKYKEDEINVKSSLMMIECRAFIYRAKLTTISRDNLNDAYNAYLRINALSCVKETKIHPKTSTPLWNQVLKIQKMVNTSPERLKMNPPYVLVEILDDKLTGREELIGRFEIQPVVDSRSGYAPKLQWYEIFNGLQNTGQVLMSVQLIPIPEKLLKTTMYAPTPGSFYAPGVKEAAAELDIFEPLPSNLIPRSMSYKVDVYWWGLRDVNVTRKPCVVLEIDELVIKSDIISDKKANSNFPNGLTTQIFESPLKEDHSPKFIIRLYDSNTFGRTVFLGTNVVKNLSKYIVDWLPKTERESSLRSVSIVSSDFCAVNGSQKLFVKKSSKIEDCEEYPSNVSKKCQTVCQAKVKRSVWKRIFSRIGPTEEEMTLLPVYAKENNQIKVVKKIPKAECADWWTRFFQSEKVGFDEDKLSSNYITIFDYELEYQPEFSKFKDWCSTLKFYNGKKTGIPEKDEHLQCGYLKVGIAIYRWPPPQNTVAVSVHGVDLNKGYFDEHPTNEPTKYLVRVYVVRAISLPKNFTGKSDLYVMLNCGKKQLGDRTAYVANTTEPIFGRLFEYSCSLPEDYLLNISLYDYQSSPPDELIGSTTIDLEDRVYTKHRARVGLAPEYRLTGSAKWKDNVKPSIILEELCAKNHLPPPLYPDAYSIIINGVEYRDDGKTHSARKRAKEGVSRVWSSTLATERKENICLSILHKWQTLPICGYHLVPEHVETRSLYRPDKPYAEKGKIQLWVDIFPLDANPFIPPPCDITPRKVEEYELRVVVWDVHNTILALDKKRTWKTADLYVKVWIGSKDCAQETDVHFRSVSGEAHFNWRMIFDFSYNHAERKLINKEISPYLEYEEYLAPVLEVQLLESNEDLFLGSLSLNLNSMYQGAKLAQQCTLAAMAKGKKIDLFSLRSVRAWWPLKFMDTVGNDVSAGVIDLELTLLPMEKATVMPCGEGRDPPFPLPPPMRASHSEENYKKWCGYISRQSCTSHIKEMFICLMIILVVWFMAYLIYLAIPNTENVIYQDKPQKDRRKNVEGVIRTLTIPLRL